jgi:hypothetical protein
MSELLTGPEAEHLIGPAIRYMDTWYLLESGQAPLAARSSAARRRVLVRA